MKDNIVDQLEDRGLVADVTSPELRKRAFDPLSLYLGFDPTADSLHLGHLEGIVVLSWFQKFGHHCLALVGGATGMIGDPSGKSKERPSLGVEELAKNIEGIRANLVSMLDTDRVAVVNNYDWYAGFGYIEFLREVGRHFRMGPMLGKDMVRTRLESAEGLSYTEFSYQILQAYDFLHLFDEHKVSLQIGGSDQWGNITSGTELIRKLRGETAYGLTFPLLTRSDGKKFGKSESGAVWLAPEKLSPYELYQYLYRTLDSDVIMMMRRLTFIGMDEVWGWEKRMDEEGYVPNSAQKRLAQEVVGWVHGEEGMKAALAATSQVVTGELTADSLEESAGQVPTLEKSEVIGTKVIDLLVEGALAASKGEARRLIKGGGVSINNKRVISEDQVFESDHLLDDRICLLAVGKKRKLLVRRA